MKKHGRDGIKRAYTKAQLHRLCQAYGVPYTLRNNKDFLARNLINTVHQGLIAKLESLGVRGNLLDWFISYLSGRTQRVTIDGVSSSWRRITAGVPQGSVLGPLLFLVYINDIVDQISSDCFLFTDDSLLLDEVTSPTQSAVKLNSDLTSISIWAQNWLVTMNAQKTKSMFFSAKLNKPHHPPLQMSGASIEDVISHDHLGVTLTSNLSWHPHILRIHQKASKRLNMIKPFKFTLQRKTLEILYFSLVHSCLEYADVVWDGCSDVDCNLLESLQFEGARVVTGAIKGTHRESLLEETAWVRLSDRRSDHKLYMMFKIVNRLAPSYLTSLCPSTFASRTTYSLRGNDDLIIPYARTERFKKSFLISSASLWNRDIRFSSSLVQFKANVAKWHNYPVRNNPLTLQRKGTKRDLFSISNSCLLA